MRALEEALDPSPIAVGLFELVVAVEHEGDRWALKDEGADLVIADLGDIFEQALAP